MSATSTGERLVYMANQIAVNFAVSGSEAAAAATADHIASFWDPRMKQRILAHLDREACSAIILNPIARRAIEMLAAGGRPMHQTLATTFAGADQVGGSDAG
jgi:formate dehydrogenase subunit delta